jgi:ribose transport system permease protein
MDQKCNAQNDRRGRFDRRALSPFAMPALLVGLFVFFCIQAPETFASYTNFRITIGAQSIIVLLALALIVPMRAGDFDLSVSAIMVLSGVTVGVLYAAGLPLAFACMGALLIGPIAGLINAMLVVLFGFDSLIATLGTMTIFGGLASLVSNNALITSIPLELMTFSIERTLGFTTPVWIGWALALMIWYVFDHTATGNHLLAIGADRRDAELAGVHGGWLRMWAFVFSGCLSAFVGLLYAGSLGAVSSTASASYLLPPITAVYLGVSAIQLGRFNVAGTLIAIYLLAIGSAGLQVIGLRDWVVDVFNGLCLIGAIAFTKMFHRREG